MRWITRLQHDHRVANPCFDVKGFRSELVPLEFDSSKGIPHQLPKCKVTMNVRPDTANAVPHMPETFDHHSGPMRLKCKDG